MANENVHTNFKVSLDIFSTIANATKPTSSPTDLEEREDVKSVESILDLYEPMSEYPSYYHESNVLDAMNKFASQFRNQPKVEQVDKAELEKEKWKGFDYACDLLDSMGYNRTSGTEYMMGDLLRLKVNRIQKGKMKKNTHYPKPFNNS